MALLSTLRPHGAERRGTNVLRDVRRDENAHRAGGRGRALAALVFHERLAWPTAAGAVVVFAGIGLALRDESKTPSY